MRKFLALILISLGVLCMVAAPSAANHNDIKVPICHRTHSDSNPYVLIEPDEAAVDGEAPAKGDHYLEHQGPIWNPTLKADHIEWGDIIPPVPGHHEGLNWTEEGQALYRSNCGQTTTTTVDDTTTTTVAETTTTTEEPTTTTTLEETTTTVGIDGSTTVPKGPKPPAPKPPVAGPNALDQAELPATGNETLYLTALGVILLLAGTGLSVRYR